MVPMPALTGAAVGGENGWFAFGMAAAATARMAAAAAGWAAPTCSNGEVWMLGLLNWRCERQKPFC